MLQVLVAISQKFYCRKEALGYAKVIHKKKMRKNGQVSEISKIMGTQMPARKKEMNKIAHVLLQSIFWVSKERYIFKEHSRIRLATYIYITYIHHISIHMHILIWLYDLTLFGFKVWLYNICIASMLFHAYSTPISST